MGVRLADMNTKQVACWFAALMLVLTAVSQDRPVWNEQEKKIIGTIQKLRSLPDGKRGDVQKDLALQVRQLPAGMNKVRLALSLASRSTEGDFGHDSLQEVTTTLALTMKEQPLPREKGRPAYPYMELANLSRYEHMQVDLADPEYLAALEEVKQQEQRRSQVEYVVKDLEGHEWSRKDLRGKVVMLNFWATWCPPCLKEMPDLEAIYKKFRGKGLVVISLSDEDETKVRRYLEQHSYDYPIAADPTAKWNKAFEIEGIPKTFVYDREGKLVTQSIDMRTRKQFEAMLAEAGLK
jgi:thiol-disulfide isomerase/thioredoxin